MLNLDFSKLQEKEYFKVGDNKAYVNGVAIKTNMNGKRFLEVKLTNGKAAMTDNIYLLDSTMWRVQQFLKACQLPHKGQVSLDEKSILSRHLIINCVAEAYTKKDGTEGTAIRVKEYKIDPEIGYSETESAPAEEVGHEVADDLPY